MLRLFLLLSLLGLPSFAQAQNLILTGLATAPITLDLAAVEAIGTTEVVDAREVTTPTGKERVEVTYRGVELGKLLEAQGIARLDRHDVRAATIMVIAKDSYRAAFSWGELFNTAGGRRVLLITAINGKVLTDREGQFSLRAFSDIRSGPRHVRDVAEIRIDLPQ